MTLGWSKIKENRGFGLIRKSKILYKSNNGNEEHNLNEYDSNLC